MHKLYRIKAGGGHLASLSGILHRRAGAGNDNKCRGWRWNWRRAAAYCEWGERQHNGSTSISSNICNWTSSTPDSVRTTCEHSRWAAANRRHSYIYFVCGRHDINYGERYTIRQLVRIRFLTSSEVMAA